MAPTPHSAGPKILRVALIQGAKITEDRTLKRRGPVTVGQEPRNTFVVPVSNLPATFTLLEYLNNQYSLVFTDQMDGKVKVGDSDLSFSALKQQGLAKKRGGGQYVLALNDGMKGRVTLGEVSILFQFVTPPPEPPKPELPSNIKSGVGGLIAGFDQLFMLILAVSLTVHFSGAGFIACQPVPEERELTLDDLPDRFAKLVAPVPLEKPKPKKEEAKGEDKKEDKKEKKEEAKATNNDKKTLQNKVASKGLLKVLTSSGSAGSAFEDVLGNSNSAGSVADALNGAAGVGVATADALAAGQKGGGAGSAAGIGDLGTSGGGNVNLGAKGDAVVHGKVADASPDVESGVVDREALARFVRARIRAIQGCYEKELKRNPSLKGKVVVRFTISTSGRATEIELEEDTMHNDAVGSCIRAIIRGWTFPFKPESDVPVAYPFVFTPSN